MVLLQRDPEGAEHVERETFIPRERPPPLEGTVSGNRQSSEGSEGALLGARNLTREQPLRSVAHVDSPRANRVLGGEIERVHQAADIDPLKVARADDPTGAQVREPILTCSIKSQATCE